MADLRAFHGPNAGYVLELYERFRQNPAAVGDGWQSFFENFTPPSDGAEAPAGAPASAPATQIDFTKIVAAHELAEAIRARGHTAAHLNPIAKPAHVDPALRAEAHGIAEGDLDGLPPEIVRGPAAAGARNARDGIQRLWEIYCGTIGYEFDHIVGASEREWLRNAVESGHFRAPLEQDQKRALLQRLSQVEGFEKYLHRAFFGQKRFSIEGTDSMVPILDEIIAEAGSSGAREVIIGMAHRGRLNVLTHVLGKPYAKMIEAFLGHTPGAEPPSELKSTDMSGDVKYHMGWRRTGEDEQRFRVLLAPNPSHLEFVNPVVIGMTRAAQDNTEQPGCPTLDPAAALAVLVHGDAAFPGQGVVPETLNMSCIRGFSVGGTLHIIANNQIGFTTLPEADRSTRYSSDLAKGFEVPVVHVNADDAEACVAVARLAFAYRERFHKDFVIDLVGYRRWGHNEGDEPAYTQPLMYDVIRAHPTARETFANHLVSEGVVSQQEADAMLQAVLDELSAVQGSLKEAGNGPAESGTDIRRTGTGEGLQTPVPAERLLELNESLLARPEGFEPNPRLGKLLEKRRDAMGEEGGIDWGHAEALAFASLLQDGVPVRLTGQDAERGTFSHRHLVLHDARKGTRHDILASLPQARASFEVYNSPLSEMAVVGFEYGYSVYDPNALVLWEAQFGDFANGAQVIIDQFIAAAFQKWGQTSGLVLLLPHGYEGQGPEHSSARLERFLQLAAQSNLRVVNCTTSAQYFHLLRRQAALLAMDPRPLVVMSPKSLLRHPLAASRIEQLASGRFEPLLGDPTAAERADEITRLLLCSGKVYVDLMASEQRARARNVALLRVEELYPFPAEQIQAQIQAFPSLREIAWVQEEPMNMGAWGFVGPRLQELAHPALTLRYIGRPERASPAEGSAAIHAANQSRIATAAWEGAEAPQRESHSGVLAGVAEFS